MDHDRSCQLLEYRNQRSTEHDELFPAVARPVLGNHVLVLERRTMNHELRETWLPLHTMFCGTSQQRCRRGAPEHIDKVVPQQLEQLRRACLVVARVISCHSYRARLPADKLRRSRPRLGATGVESKTRVRLRCTECSIRFSTQTARYAADPPRPHALCVFARR